MSQKALARLKVYDWPGNIRELENIIERCVVITREDLIDVQHLPKEILDSALDGRCQRQDARLDTAIDTIERDVIQKALVDCGGNKTKAALLLGISRRSLHRKLLKYEIEDN